MSKFSNFLGINVKTIIPYVDILLLQKYNCFVGNLFKKENPTASWEIISERKPELHHGK
jgi:hypothetical protein